MTACWLGTRTYSEKEPVPTMPSPNTASPTWLVSRSVQLRHVGALADADDDAGEVGAHGASLPKIWGAFCCR